MKTMTGMKS